MLSENVSSADNQQERLLNPHYIVGLVDGEGYFSVSPRIRKRKASLGRTVEMKFGIELKESDKEVLDRVKDTFCCGHIYLKTDKRENFCNLYMFRVCDRKDIVEIIIPFFTKYRLNVPSKRKSFDYFCMIAEIINKDSHLTDKGFEEIKQLVKEMH